MRVWQKIKNWCRGWGWDLSDLESLQRKLAAENRPGAVIPLTRREGNAMKACRGIYCPPEKELK